MLAKTISIMCMLSTGLVLWDAPLENYLMAINEEGFLTAGMVPGQPHGGNGVIQRKLQDKGKSPEQTVDGITARSNDWTEPSINSEQQYIMAIRNWLLSLAPETRVIASNIMREAHPVMHDLREAIREKKAQLANLSLGRDTLPETLPRLGVELQKLRAALHAELVNLKGRIKREAGVDMGPLGKDTFWLKLPTHPKYSSSRSPN